MKALLIPPSESLIAGISGRLTGTERDYSSNLVVFPGKRPSHFLRKALAAELKSSFVPPVIFSMDEFVDYVYEAAGTKMKLETIDAVAILYDIHRDAPSPLGGNSFLTPDSFFPIGIKIYRDIEELCIEGIKPSLTKEIEAFTKETVPERTFKRLQSLSFFYEEFYKRIEYLGFSTRSVRYCAVSGGMDKSDAGRFQQMIFAGFFALTRCEKDLFRKLYSLENTVFIFQDGAGMKEKIAELNMEVVRYKAEADEPETHFYRSPDTHGQVYALSRILEKEPANERTVIVLPSSEALFPLLRQGLSVLDEDSYNISLGYPLHRTPVFAFINSLFELINSTDEDRIYLPDYLKFMLHPYTKNLYLDGKAEITRIMFHSMEEYLTRRRTKTSLSLQEIISDDKLLDHIIERMPDDEGSGLDRNRIKDHLCSIHHNTIERFLSFEDIKDFAVKCTGLIKYIFNNSTARQHPLFHPFSESFIKSMDTVSCSLMKDMSFAERSSYFSFFRKYIMTCYTPFGGTPLKGLQVLGFLETRNLKFDRVFVLDANEDTMPDTRKDDTLLPFKAREWLGLPTYMDRDRLAAYHFGCLLGGAKEAHLFFVENDKKEMSRFIERLLWDKQKNDRTTDTKKYLRSVRYKINLANSAPSDIRKTGSVAGFLKDHLYTATALDRYLKCQLRFYYSHVLRMGRKEEISGEIETADIGIFVHKVLSRYFGGKRGRPLKEQDINIYEMNMLIDQLFENEYGNNPAGAAYLLKRQIKDHLSDLLRKYYIPLLREKRVVILESEHDIRVSIDSFNLKGRIDSIEKRDKRVVIVDYKTGSNQNYLKINLDKLDIGDRDSWSEAIGSLQLPFYLMLYAEHTKTSIKDMDGMFLLLGRSIIGREIELSLFDNADAEETFTTLRAVMTGLLREIADAELPFTPPRDRKRVCPLCDFQHICGTQWVIV